MYDLTDHWNDYGASYDLTDLPATASNHIPLILRIKPHYNPHKRLFKFEIFWLKYEDMKGVVQRAWSIVTTQNPVVWFQKKNQDGAKRIANMGTSKIH